MGLAFIEQDTTDPSWSVWVLCNTETVECVDGVRELPGRIYGCVQTPSGFNEAQARAEFHRKKASDAALLARLDALIDDPALK